MHIRNILELWNANLMMGWKPSQNKNPQVSTFKSGKGKNISLNNYNIIQMLGKKKFKKSWSLRPPYKFSYFITAQSVLYIAY